MTTNSEDNPTTLLWENTFGKVEQFGFKIASSPQTLLNVPTVKIDLSSGDLELECRGYQDQPPHEGFNHLRTPFMPWGWSKVENSEEEQNRLAFIQSQDYSTWSEKLRVLRKREHGMLTVKSQTFGGTSCKLIDKKQGPHVNHLKYYRKLKDQLDEYPFGPSSLYSSSCLQVFSFKGEEPNNQYLFHGDFSGNLKINKIICDSDQLSLNNKNKPFSLKLDRSKEVKVCDDKLKKYSRIFGVIPSEEQNVVGLKYWEGAAIAKLKLEDQECTIGAEIISSQDLTGKCCCDLAFVDNLDSSLLIDSSGTLSMIDLTTTKCVNRWEDAFSKELEGFEWARLQPSTSSPYLFRVGSRKSIDLFDIRTGVNRLKLINWLDGECLGGMAASQFSPFQLYCSTNSKTYLMDERVTGKSMTEWTHPPSRENHDIPSGCDAVMTSKNGLEYVSTHWSDGEVVLLANDWKHGHCAEREADIRTGAKLSCQVPAKKMSDHEKILYPVLRGLPVTIPSIQYLLNQCSNLDPKSYNRLQVPWTGLKMSVPTDQSLAVFSVNAVGDLFLAEVDNKAQIVSDRYSHRINKVDCDKDFNFSSDFEDDDLNASSAMKNQNFMSSSDFSSPFWLLDRPIPNVRDPHNSLVKIWSEKWEREYLTPIHDRWSKINFATFLQQRPKLMSDETLDFPIPEVKLKPAKKTPKEVPKPKSRRGRPPKIVQTEKPSPPFPSLPDLLPLEEPVTGLTSLKVLHIFNSVEDVFNEIVVSDEENRKHLVPSGSIERRKGRAAVDEGEYRVYPHLQPSRAIAEVAESTLDFTAGLDQADGTMMVSTQQPPESQEYVRPNMTTQNHPVGFDSQSSFFFSQSQSQSQSQKPKKKKKYQAGF